MIQIYGLLIRLSSPFYKKAKLWLEGRENQDLRVAAFIAKHPNAPLIWIHAASYGEFEMSRPIIERLKANFGHLKFVVSFYSPSGFENIDLPQEDFLKIYLPLDLKSKHRALITQINPKAVIIIKYEFWFNFLGELKHQGIPYYFTSLHLNSNSYLFKPLFKSFLNCLKSAQKIYCHNSNSIEILKQHNFENIELFGDTRLDQVLKNKSLIKPKHNIKWADPQGFVFAFGSVTEFELPKVIAFCNRNKEHRYVIATHDIEDNLLEKLKRNLSSEQVLFSKLNNKSVDKKILIVDTYGDLKYLYKNADIAYVGAGFEKGPHNLLEPLIYNIPIVCGSNIDKFPMARYLEETKLLLVLNKINDLPSIMTYLQNMDREAFKIKSKKFFQDNEVNTDHLILDLKSIINN